MTIDVPERGVSVEDGQATAKPIGRRTVLAGAAWAVPAIAVATAAPAHAASGLRLAFDNTTYAAVACGILTGVQVSLLNGSQPVQGASVVVSLPSGYTFDGGSSSNSGVTDASGKYAVPPINIGVGASDNSITATAGSLVANTLVTVAPNTNALGASQTNPIAQTWANTPKGAKPVGANYFLSANGELWFENTRVATGVVTAVGVFHRGYNAQYADYVLSNGRKYRAKWSGVEAEYDKVPAGMRPVGQRYFLSDAGDLVWDTDAKPVTGNVRSVVAWADNDEIFADIELTTGVLVRAHDENIIATFSPMPENAVPIGADYFLSPDGDLFYQANFVAAQVASAAGWYHRARNAPYADYMTQSGKALRAWEHRPRDNAYTNVPAGAKPVGGFYYLASNGDLYWDDKFATAGVDVATGWCTSGGDLHADLRLKSGAAVRMKFEKIDLMLSPMPAGAVPIRAEYHFDAANGELYYQGKLLVAGVVSAMGWHQVGQANYADYITTAGQAYRARYESATDTPYTGIPTNATALGGGYFLADGVLRWRDKIVARTVESAVARSDRDNTCCDFRLSSGALARARDERIERTYSPMPNDAAAVGADYFLTPSGELYWQGRLIATDVISASGWWFRTWNEQVCTYVTRDGVGYQAGNERPADQTFRPTGVAYVKALTSDYFLTADNTLYWGADKVNLQIDKVMTWNDSGGTHADVRTADGKLHRLWDRSIEESYPSLPADAVPLGNSYFLTSAGSLYFKEQLVVTGVADAVGWYDSKDQGSRADYRGSDGIVRRAHREQPNQKTYTGAPAGAQLLGFGYFRTSTNELWFEGTLVAPGIASVGAWSDNDYFYATYRRTDGQALRARGATPNQSTWIAGNAPLNANLIGARYALDSTGVLYFDGQGVTNGVTGAVGWYFRNNDQFYADYFKNGVAERAAGTVAGNPVYGGTPSGAALLGYGYFLAGTDLWYEGAAIRTGVTSGAGWANGQDPFCDYRTADLASYRAKRAIPQDAVWTTGLTPIGSEPRGADYYLSGDGVLSFRGTLVATGVTEAIGWVNPQVDRQFADYRGAQGNAFLADQTSVNPTIYNSVPSDAVAVGAGYWLTPGGALYFGNASIRTGVATARGWAEFAQESGPSQLATYRVATGAAFRARGAAAANRSWAPGLTPLGAKPVGAGFFLLGDQLYWGGSFVVGSVQVATGWQDCQDDVQFADYFKTDGTAYRARRAVNSLDLSYAAMPAGTEPVGAGYFLSPDKKLYFQGALIAQQVASAAGWSNPPQRAAYAQIVAC